MKAKHDAENLQILHKTKLNAEAKTQDHRTVHRRLKKERTHRNRKFGSRGGNKNTKLAVISQNSPDSRRTSGRQLLAPMFMVVVSVASLITLSITARKDFIHAIF